MSARVALLGAGGEVGTQVLRRFATDGVLGSVRLRVGGRHPARAAAAAESLGIDAEAVTVDLWDERSLARFCTDVDLVVNCAGPGFRVGATVALAALAAGAEHVDVAGDDPALERITASDAARDGRVLLSAGTVPGLSALLPRYLAARVGHPVRVTMWAGGAEHCSETVAVDMLLSLTSGGPGGKPYGLPGAAWRAGMPRERALTVQEGVHLDGFHGASVLQPMLSAEGERLARTSGLAALDSWNVWPEGHAWDVLRVLPALAADPATGTASIVERLRRAAELDLVGVEPWYRMRVRADGAAGVEQLELTAASSTILTATMLTAAARHLLGTARSGGVAFAADALEPEPVLEMLGSSPEIELLASDAGVVEGAL